MLHQLSAQDAQFLYIQTSSNLTHVTGVAIFDPSTAPDGKVRLKDIIRHFESRLHTSPVFKRKLYRLPLDYDHPYWVEDKDFDLESHIWHSRLPEPGDWRQFCIFVARHHSRPMDMSRPLWDIMVLEGLDGIGEFAKGSYAVITRVHHSAIDGTSAAHFFAAISDLTPEGFPAIKIPDEAPDYGTVPSHKQALMRSTKSNVTSPVKMANSLMRFAPAALKASSQSLSRKKTTSEPGVPETRFNGRVSPQKVFDGVTFELSRLKAIKNKVEGATINDVVLAICSGALRKYLSQHDELPDIPLVGWSPINARKRAGEEESPGNNISAMTVKLATDIADPFERLETIRNLTRQTKAAKAGLSARLMTDLTQHIPGATMAGIAKIMTSERFAPKLSNVFISNVPGPQIPLYMNGAKCTHQYALAPLGNGMGLFIATPSYNGMMSFNITSDRKIMPDIAFFRDCIIESLEDFEKVKTAPAAVKTTKPKKRKTPTTKKTKNTAKSKQKPSSESSNKAKPKS